MKNTDYWKRLTMATRKNRSGLLSLAVVLLCGLGVSTSAQNLTRIAHEKGFTIAPNVQTPIVLKTTPDAECDLHAEGISDNKLRVYANLEGYVRFHANAKQESDEGMHFQLDCKSNGKITRYPLHLRASSEPTAEMPSPPSNVPTPKGSHIRPALTEAEAQQLSDQDLMRRGYPHRPDPMESPDAYREWLDHVSRPMTLIPAHSVSRSDITAVPSTRTSANWSGLEGHNKYTHHYDGVEGEWNVPLLTSGESGTTYSATWVGLDGDHLSDLVQAGSEQDYTEIPFFQFASYSSWTELLPNQPTEQGTSLSINPGDDLFVSVWIGDSMGFENVNGGYGWFYLADKTTAQAVKINTPLAGTYFNGKEAEWIMERPTVSGSLPDLSDYGSLKMWNAYALKAGSSWVPCGTAAKYILNMVNGADLLSQGGWYGYGTHYTTFTWFNFH